MSNTPKTRADTIKILDVIPAAGVVVLPKESRTPVYDVLGVPVLMKISGDDTDGRMALFYVTVPPMSGPPLHRHTREEECFYVLDGEITWQINERRITGKT